MPKKKKNIHQITKNLLHKWSQIAPNDLKIIDILGAMLSMIKI
jgi:hypothetical protein